MAPVTKVAIITGGASGIGLATAQKLNERPDWEIHILDLNSEQGRKALSTLNHGAQFHAIDINNYAALGQLFKAIFLRHNRLDLVYANAGVGEKNNGFYAAHNTGVDPPPSPPDLDKVVNICLNAAITTSYLAAHYFALSPKDTRGDRSLVITASCGALYPSYGSPIYTATKHGILGFARSIAPVYWRDAGIRVNAVLPGTVRTNLLTQEQWKQFPVEYFTPVATIVEAVMCFVDGKDDLHPEVKEMRGKAVECSGVNRYYREQYPYCDEAMATVMAATDTGS